MPWKAKASSMAQTTEKVVRMYLRRSQYDFLVLTNTPGVYSHSRR